MESKIDSKMGGGGGNLVYNCRIDFECLLNTCALQLYNKIKNMLVISGMHYILAFLVVNRAML